MTEHAHAHSHDQPAGGVIDPVCGMTVDPHTTPHRHSHHGRTYYFCSAGCRAKFAAAPGKYLADDAQGRSEFKEAVDYLARLVKASAEPADKITNLMRQAEMTADGLDDPKTAIDLYEGLLTELDAKHDPALAKIAELYAKLDDPKGRAAALERRLTVLEDPVQKLDSDP